MKKLTLTTLTVFTIILGIQGQCIIDAGINRNVCLQEIYDGPLLQGEAIEGDFVQFAWHSEYYLSFTDDYFYASSMLNDTTLLQPIIEQHYEETVKYYLTGTTSTNETCTDSVELNFSDWIFLTQDKITGKMPEDTIQLWISAISFWPHVQYEWSPNYMISDTTVEQPLVWNDTTTFYDVVITDSLGCSVTDQTFKVYVTISSVLEKDEVDLNIYPNPVQDRLSVLTDLEISRIKIYDLNGRLIIYSEQKEIDVSKLESGNYIVQVESSNRKSISRIVQIIGY
ncbi:MAG: T9SS type A sorting domain-containing protein [Bacteroidota bacterium]